MQLNYQRYPDQPPVHHRPPLLIVPGLFGSTANWRSIAKHIGETYPVWVIDMRNHGGSAHASSHTYQDMSNDLLTFLDHHELAEVILCGHSMGGKAAMWFSLQHPSRVAKLAVLDIAPVRYLHSHAPFLERLIELDLSTLTSRSEADRALQQAIPDVGTRLFLLQNLRLLEGQYQWRINVRVLHEYMSEIMSFPSMKNAISPFLREAFFIHGELSDYVLPEHRPEIAKLFSNARFVSIEGAGHWLNVDQPTALISTLENLF